MKLSTKGRYSLRSMLALACIANGSERPVSLKQISEHEKISVSYLEQLFVHLRRAGLVRSVRGPGGGYLFARPLEEITVGEVMDVVNETVQPVDCSKCTHEATACGAPRKGGGACLARPVWEKLEQHISSYLETLTLRQIIDRQIR
ncbi:MAG: Rrf2 family transcriptional regulator [Deltaproteobacteria bacterium]|nr:Rrf2 family transcriptional regulator [Candidatus Anaeroferrophillacea bacterium]